MKHLVIFLGMVVGIHIYTWNYDKDWSEALRITWVSGIAILLCYFFS